MAESGVYNSTTISYENPGGGLSMSSPGAQNRPWNLSEVVYPPPNRTRMFQWTLLLGGSITFGLGLIVTIIGVYNQHYYDPSSHNVTVEDGPSRHWLATLLGLLLALVGLVLLFIYCKSVNRNWTLCRPGTSLRQMVTKPRFQNGQTPQGTNLLSGGRNNHPLSTQYDPVKDINRYHQPEDITSEEKAKLMAHEAREGSHKSAQGKENARPGFNPGRTPSPPPQRPLRQFSSLRRTNPATSQFHYKPRHFAGHGYGQGRFPPGFAIPPAPLASAEDITHSLRSSFASVMMYPPSDWGNSSNESINSAVFFNLPPVKPEDRADIDDFRVSPKGSVSSMSVHSAFS